MVNSAISNLHGRTFLSQNSMLQLILLAKVYASFRIYICASYLFFAFFELRFKYFITQLHGKVCNSKCNLLFAMLYLS